MPHPPTHPDPVVGVCDTVAAVLGIEDRRDTLSAETELFGAIPELDSLSVLELATTLEERYDIVIADEDFTAEVFGTIGSLAAFVRAQSAGSD